MKSKILLLLFTIFISFNSLAQDRGKVTIAISSFPPFEFEENGVVQGLDADIVRQVMQRIGYDVSIKNYPWKRAMDLVKNGEVDAIMSLRKSPDREKDFIFADPLAPTQNFFFKKKEMKISETKISDLSKYRVGIINGYVYDKSFVESDFKKLEVASSNDPEIINLKKIVTGRIDMAICEVNVCQHLINSNPELKDVDYIKDLPVGSVESFYIAFSKKDMNKSQKLISKFNEELAKFVAEGERDKLIKKYNLINLK